MIAIDTIRLTLATIVGEAHRDLARRAAQLRERQPRRARRAAPAARASTSSASRGISISVPTSSSAMAR